MGWEEDEPLEEDQIADANSDIVRRILRGRKQIISHEGTSQYGGGGVSACGLAALNCVRVILEKERGGLRGTHLLHDILSQKSAEEIISICTQWSGSSHLEVEDIFSIPLFNTCLSLFSSHFERPGFDQFKALLRKLQSGPARNVSAAVVITRPPEIITCLKIVTRSTDVFLIFDSHPRPSHPDGAGFIFNTSIDATASYLHKLLAVDSDLLDDTSMSWQTQLLGHFSGHMFVSKESHAVADSTQTVLESSLAILALRAEVASLKLQNLSLVDAQRPDMEAENTGDQLHKTSRLQSPKSQASGYQNDSHKVRSRAPNASNYRGQTPRPPALSPSYVPENGNNNMNQSEYLHTQSVAPADTTDFITDDDDFALAVQLQLEWEDTQHRDAEIAAETQREFEAEDRRLINERQALANLIQPIFTCGMCLDNHPEDSVARVPTCQHSFCRDCLRSYVLSKLREHQYPVFCPTCMARNERSDPGVVTEAMVRQIGIPENDYQVLEELQLSTFSILLHCRQCRRSMFVARDEYQESPTLVCPLPGCYYEWCKSCQQPAPADGPKHSCDGSAELEHLMRQRGWKYCPGCNTPIQKSSGCNHMTCASPGCNTHFCYRCGDIIVKSALRTEIREATSAHYRRCSLFDEIPDQPTPP